MLDRFDHETYWWILDRLSRTHRPVRFADLKSGLPGTPFFILRHDVDYCPAAALRLAEMEAARGVRATYFLLLNTSYYNLLSPEHAGVARRIAELGHEVGLHYDVRFLQAFPRPQWEDLLAEQAGLLGRLSGVPVESIATHQPALVGEDPLRGRTRFLDAYADRFFKEMVYVSDSCRAWRDAAWRMLDTGPVPDRLQLVLHPVNWGPLDRDRVAIFAGVHAELRARLDDAERDLAEKVARHSGVLEHEARLRRGSRDETS